MNLLLFLGIVFLSTLLLGMFLEKIRIPWIFAALILGLGLAFYNPFSQLTASPTFEFLAKLGMYFFLFVIGFEIDFEKMKKRSSFLIKVSFFIIFAEILFTSLFIHFVFGTPWFVTLLVAAIFATVGEAALLPILDKFNLTKKNLGQTILGVGVVDDIIEVVVVTTTLIFIGTKQAGGGGSVLLSLVALVSLFIGAFVLIKFGSKGKKFKVPEVEQLILFLMAVLFLMMGIGQYAEAAALGALAAGIGLKNFVPRERLKSVETEVKSMAYALFGPLFFLWVGMEVSISYPASMDSWAPWLPPVILFVTLVLAKILLVSGSKISASYLAAKNYLGEKKALVMGVALSVKFSTSVVMIKILFEKGLIGDALYSVLIVSKIGIEFIVPFLLAYLIAKWDIGLNINKKVKIQGDKTVK